MTLWQIFQNVWNFLIKPLLSAFVTYLKNTFWLPIKGVFDLMTAALKSVGLSWSDVWNGIKNTVFAILGAIVNEVKSRINTVINIINGLINGANSIGSNVPGYTKINTIPNLANGIDNFKGGMARVGEQGPETVYLPQGSRVTPYSPTGGGGERPIEVTQIINSGVDMDFAFRELAYVLRTN
jgi:phage-related protein